MAIPNTARKLSPDSRDRRSCVGQAASVLRGQCQGWSSRVCVHTQLAANIEEDEDEEDVELVERARGGIGAARSPLARFPQIKPVAVVWSSFSFLRVSSPLSPVIARFAVHACRSSLVNLSQGPVTRRTGPDRSRRYPEGVHGRWPRIRRATANGTSCGGRC